MHACLDTDGDCTIDHSLIINLPLLSMECRILPRKGRLGRIRAESVEGRFTPIYWPASLLLFTNRSRFEEQKGFVSHIFWCFQWTVSCQDVILCSLPSRSASGQHQWILLMDATVPSHCSLVTWNVEQKTWREKDL